MVEIPFVLPKRLPCPGLGGVAVDTTGTLFPLFGAGLAGVVRPFAVDDAARACVPAVASVVNCFGWLAIPSADVLLVDATSVVDGVLDANEPRVTAGWAGRGAGTGAGEILIEDAPGATVDFGLTRSAAGRLAGVGLAGDAEVAMVGVVLAADAPGRLTVNDLGGRLLLLVYRADNRVFGRLLACLCTGEGVAVELSTFAATSRVVELGTVDGIEVGVLRVPSFTPKGCGGLVTRWVWVTAAPFTPAAAFLATVSTLSSSHPAFSAFLFKGTNALIDTCAFAFCSCCVTAFEA